MQVEVVYVDAQHEFISTLEVAADSTVHQAILQSKILEQFPHLSLEQNKVGIFGECVDLETKLAPNDRVEIYRPLNLDPMQARRIRADEQRDK